MRGGIYTDHVGSCTMLVFQENLTHWASLRCLSNQRSHPPLCPLGKSRTQSEAQTVQNMVREEFTNQITGIRLLSGLPMLGLHNTGFHLNYPPPLAGRRHTKIRISSSAKKQTNMKTPATADWNSGVSRFVSTLPSSLHKKTFTF